MVCKKGKKEAELGKNEKSWMIWREKSILSKNQFHINGKSFQYPHTECRREC